MTGCRWGLQQAFDSFSAMAAQAFGIYNISNAMAAQASASAKAWWWRVKS